MENGYVRIPEGPGLGIELEENQIANKLDHDCRNRETYDLNDGSVAASPIRRKRRQGRGVVLGGCAGITAPGPTAH